MCEIYSIINAQFIFQGLKYLIFNSIQKQNDIKYFLLLTTLLLLVTSLILEGGRVILFRILFHLLGVIWNAYESPQHWSLI